jgi:hypothetical protein
MKKPYFLYKGNELVDVCLSKKEIGNVSYDFLTRSVGEIPELIKWDKHQAKPKKEQASYDGYEQVFCEADIIDLKARNQKVERKLTKNGYFLETRSETMQRRAREKEREEESKRLEIAALSASEYAERLRRIIQASENKKKIDNLIIPIDPLNHKYGFDYKRGCGYLGYLENDSNLSFFYYDGDKFYTLVLQNNLPVVKVIDNFIASHEVNLFGIGSLIRSIPKERIPEAAPPYQKGWYLFLDGEEILPAIYSEEIGKFYGRPMKGKYQSPIYFIGSRI